MKQQLQREQLQELERQELERRENERKLSIVNNNHGSGLSNVDHQTFLSHTNQQLQIPRSNYASESNMFMASSPVPSTTSSDFSTSQYPNQMSPHQTQQQPSAPLKVPLHIGVDLPPQVLKVNKLTYIEHITSMSF